MVPDEIGMLLVSGRCQFSAILPVFAQEEKGGPKDSNISDLCGFGNMVLFNHPRGISWYIQVQDQLRSWCSMKSFKNYRLSDNQKTAATVATLSTNWQTRNSFFLGRAVAVGKNGKSLSIPLSDPCSNKNFVLNSPSFLWIRLSNGLMEKAYLIASYKQVASPIYSASKQMIKGYERLLGNKISQATIR